MAGVVPGRHPRIEELASIGDLLVLANFNASFGPAARRRAVGEFSEGRVVPQHLRAYEDAFAAPSLASGR